MSAKWRLNRHCVPDVYKNLACVNAVSNAQSATDILAPDSANQAIFTVIGDANGVFLCVKWDHHTDWAENFFPSDPYVV